VLISQFNIARITDMGFPVGASERWQNALHDLGGMFDLYLPLVAIALLIAFLVTAFGVIRLVNKPSLLYPLAGFTALIAMHLILYAVFGMSPVAPTRTLAGLLAQGLAGAVGGYVYLKIANPGRVA
ncbi:MAG: hypothetical protein KJP04_07880, partial [Arenicella sp.]|nr:hypothetical protein [Arenicella sp.]